MPRNPKWLASQRDCHTCAHGDRPEGEECRGCRYEKEPQVDGKFTNYQPRESPQKPPPA